MTIALDQWITNCEGVKLHVYTDTTGHATIGIGHNMANGITLAIATALLEERLAACVNIFPGVRSLYRWQGNVEASEEAVLIAKSRRDLFSRLEEKVKSLSSYNCPCIVAWALAEGHQPYLEWLGAELATG
jgi:periplasmic divalent cation tolerance protein